MSLFTGTLLVQIAGTLYVSTDSKRTFNREKVLSMRTQGIGASHIAKHLSIGRSTVYKILKTAKA